MDYDISPKNMILMEVEKYPLRLTSWNRFHIQQVYSGMFYVIEKQTSLFQMSLCTRFI